MDLDENELGGKVSRYSMTLFPENEFLDPKANGATLNETSGFYRRTRNALAVSATYLYR